MQSNIDVKPRYLTTPDAARYSGLGIRFLEKARVSGTGPNFSRVSNRVVYCVDDLDAYLQARRVSSTAEADLVDSEATG